MVSKLVHFTVLFLMAGWQAASLHYLPIYRQPFDPNGGLLQSGLPDWGLMIGTGGDSAYFRKYSNVGDTFYQIMHGAETAFTLRTPASHAICLPHVRRSP